MDSVFDALQWLAMLVTVLASWLVGAQSKTRRKAGFWIFTLSNILWTIWAGHVHAYALIALQIALFGLNLRGIFKNESAAGSEVSQVSK